MSARTQFVVQFLVLLAFWLALSDQYNPLFLIMGVASALGVTALTQRLVTTCFADTPRALRPVRRAVGLVVYVGWMIVSMVIAGAQIAYFVCHPRMPLQPGLLRFRTGLRSPLARVILANSITLVPGTLTLRLDDDEYLVHALVPASADDLLTGEMQRKVGGMFLEQPDDPVTAAWEALADEPRESG